MNTVKLMAMALATFSSLPLAAQQQVNAAAQQSVSSSTPGTDLNESGSAGVTTEAAPHGAQVTGSAAGSGSAGASGAASGIGAVSGSTSGSAAAGAEMRPVNGELVGKLDSKSAKAGDQVVVKTTESTKTADGTVIPKGTRLVGHVTSVQAHGSGSANSQMAIQFDRAELKGGQNLAIHSEIRSVAPAGNAFAGSSMESEDAFGGSTMGGGVRAGGLARTSARLSSGVGSTAAESARASGHVVGNAATTAGGRANAGAGMNGAVAAHATGVRGVMLSGDAAGRTSGTLSAAKQNVHLDSGTQMTLGVSTVR